MLFIVILAILIAFSYQPPPDLWQITPATSALAGVAAMLAVNWVLAEAFAELTVRRLARSADSHGATLRSHQRLRWAHSVVLLTGFLAVVFGLDWPAVVRETWGLGRWVLVDDVAVLCPFLASLIASHLAHCRVEHAARSCLPGDTGMVAGRRWRGRDLDFLLRHQLGVLLGPLFLLLAAQDVVDLAVGGTRLQGPVELAVGLGGLAAVLVFAPVLLRWLWRARPLPAGPMRDRLEAMARRLRFSASDILIWDTHGTVINAAVAGILPRPRYVLLSDALLDALRPDEIEAVFGHEVGHIRHHHLWFYIGFLQGATVFLLAIMIAVRGVVEALLGSSAGSQIAWLGQGLLLPLGCSALYFGVFFGFLSRRFERQADIFGCRAISCGHRDCGDAHQPTESSSGPVAICPTAIATFVATLERIALLNGSPRDLRSWRHFSIAKRVEFLCRVALDPGLERRFQAVVVALKVLVLTAIVAAGSWAWLRSPVLAELLAPMP
jgi:STE24 endopeptidase